MTCETTVPKKQWVIKHEKCRTNVESIRTMQSGRKKVNKRPNRARCSSFFSFLVQDTRQNKQTTKSNYISVLQATFSEKGT